MADDDILKPEIGKIETSYIWEIWNPDWLVKINPEETENEDGR